MLQDRKNWQAFVNVLMKFRFPLNAGNLLIAYEVLHSQEELSSMELVNYVHALNSRASMMQISMFGRVECLRGGLRSEERVVQY